MNYNQKRALENEMVRIINQTPGGINTRVLITQALSNLGISNATRYHAAGMIAWLIKSYNFRLILRTPGHSVIS